MNKLTRNQKLWLYTRGGRTIDDVVWIWNAPYTPMLVEGMEKFFLIPDEKIKLETWTKRAIRHIGESDIFTESLKSYIIESRLINR